METNITFKEIKGHTICTELLGDGVIIDIGARSFSFAEYFTDKQVYCIDPDPKVFEDPKANALNFHNMNVAISDKAGESGYYENGEATCLKQIDPDQNHPFIPCQTITMEDLYKVTGENVDVLKLDCEGAEYIILGETFEPIPRQITIEWHKHCVPEMHDRCYPSCKERLMKDYVMIDEVLEAKHGCSPNIWDQLWLRKDLL